MDIIERAKEIILQPKNAWEKIKYEETGIRELFTSYAAVLAAIPAVAYFIGLSIVGFQMQGMHQSVPPVSGAIYALLQFILTLAGMYAVAMIIENLAPYFGSRRDRASAFKVSVYSWTPALVAGIFGVFPPMAPLTILASLYSLYVFFIGLPVLMETPKEKSVIYFVLVIIGSLLVWVALSALAALAIRMPPVSMSP